MAFVGKLAAKCKMIRELYEVLYARDESQEPCTIVLSRKDQKLFSSMERFHKLSHTRYRFPV